MADSTVQVIGDGDGLAVIGDPSDVERFLASEGLVSKELGLHRLRPILQAATTVAQEGSAITAQSGRWVKLTDESAHLVDKFGLRSSATTGLPTGALKGEKGQIAGFVQFASDSKLGPGLANPAILAGIGGIMAQAAMEQTMAEIADYLAAIDQKVDDVLRAQKDAVLADMIGVDFVIDEAMTIRDQVGRVSEVTWSKVHATSATIARTQAYVLRQLDALAERLERDRDIRDLAKSAKEAESKVQEWLAVLARCFQLLDAIAVLELDRVLDASPDELEQHRLGLTTARRNRLNLIARSTERLLDRMNAAAGVANAKVLLNPISSPAVVQSSNHVTAGIYDFRVLLGLEEGHQALQARRWGEAAVEVRDKVRETGAETVHTARRFGSDTFDRARSVPRRVSGGFAERARRRRGTDGEGDAEVE